MEDIEVEVLRSSVKIPTIFVIPAVCLLTVYTLLYFGLNTNQLRSTVESELNQRVPGTITVKELVVEPSMTAVKVFDATVIDGTGQRVVQARSIRAGVNPFVLLMRRVQVEYAVVDGLFTHIDIRPESGYTLLTALGFGSDEEEENSAEKLISKLTVSNIQVNDATVIFDMENLHFEIPNVSIENVDVDITDNSKVVKLPVLEVEKINFDFDNKLFRLGPDWGHWRPTADDVRIENWSWVGDGFTVERVFFGLAGTTLDASGTMRFPDVEDDDKSFVYTGEGRLIAPYWSNAGQYFIKDFTHFETRYIDLQTSGDLGDVEVYGRFDLAQLDGYGAQFQDVVGTFEIHNEIVSVGETTGFAYGGDGSVDHAYFNMYTGAYGGQATVKDINPGPLVQDFGFDYPWIEGAASGTLGFIGQMPYEPKVGDKGETLVLAGAPEYTDRAVDAVALTDWTFKRESRELLPGTRFRIREGARFWSQQDYFGVDRAIVDSELASFTFRDFNFNYETWLVERALNGALFKMDVQTDDVGPLVRFYGGSGVSGGLQMGIQAEGPMNYPDATFAISLTEPRINVSTVDLTGTKAFANGRLKNGRANFDELSFDGTQGSLSARGFIEVLSNPAGIYDPIKEQETTDYLYTSRNRAGLDVEVSDFEMSALKQFIGYNLDLDGRVNATAKISNTLQSPTTDFDIRSNEFTAFGQSIASLEAKGSTRGGAFSIDKLVVDAGDAGGISGAMQIAQDGGLSFETDLTDIDLSKIVPLKTATGRDWNGTGSVKLEGAGTTSAPAIGGYIRIDDVAMDKRNLGDLALVVNTIGETIHLSGAMLTLGTIDAEIPLDGDSSYYARIGLDHLDLREAVSEIRSTGLFDAAEVTGNVEVYLDPDFNRYQVLGNFTDLRVATLNREFRNRGPVVVGLNDGALLQIQEAEIGTRGRFVALSGGVFLDQALIDLKIDGDLDLSLLNGFRLTFPDFFPETFLEATGIARVDVEMRGPPGELALLGDVTIEPSEILLRDFGEPLVLIGGRLSLDRDRIRVLSTDPIRGRVLGGVFSVDGIVGMDGLSPANLQANIWSHNLSYRIPDVADFAFDADAQIRMPNFDRPDTWSVGGEVRILDGRYFENVSIFQEALTNRLLGVFTRKTETYEASLVERFPELEEVNWDLNIQARDGFKIENEIDRLGLDLDLRVDVRFRNTLLNPNLTGDIDVVGGRVAFQGEAFEVRSGNLLFTGNASNPRVDVVADADIQNACRDRSFSAEAATTMSLSGVQDQGDSQNYHVILNVRGEFEKLDIQFESNPFADQRDILSLLLTGCTVDQLTASSASSPTLEVALGPVLGWIEGQVQDVVDVEEFTITPSFDRIEATVGDSLTRRLSWRLQLDTGLTEASGGQLGQLIYKLSDSWQAQLSESLSDSARVEEQNFLIEFKLKYRLLID